jgi:hypothetical protein
MPLSGLLGWISSRCGVVEAGDGGETLAGEYCGIFKTPISRMVEFVRMGFKAPSTGCWDSQRAAMTTDVVHIAAGTPETKRLIATALMNLSMPGLEVETTICAVARLLETKASRGPVERLSVTVLTSR